MNTIFSKIIEGLQTEKRAFSTTDTQIVSDRVALTVLPELHSNAPTRFELRFQPPMRIEEISQATFPMLFFKFALRGRADWADLMQRALQSAVSRRYFSETVGGWVLQSGVSDSDTVILLSRTMP